MAKQQVMMVVAVKIQNRNHVQLLVQIANAVALMDKVAKRQISHGNAALKMSMRLLLLTAYYAHPSVQELAKTIVALQVHVNAQLVKNMLLLVTPANQNAQAIRCVISMVSAAVLTVL